MDFNNLDMKKLMVLPLILGLSIVVSSIVIATAIYKVRALDNSLQVTGSARQKITSDTVRWVGNFSRSIIGSDLKPGYDLMAKDLVQVKKFFKDQGIDESKFDVSPIFTEQQYNYDTSAFRPREYTLRQTVEIQSNEVDKITDLAKNLQSLVGTGVFFTTQSLEYYYSKLPELRVELLGDAVKDAQARAERIAGSSGNKVGTLKSASVGVVQVLPINSTEVADYGAYDTSKIEKEVMVTVKATFRLK